MRKKDYGIVAQTRLTRKQYVALKQVADETGESVSGWLRRLILEKLRYIDGRKRGADWT